MLNEKLQIEGRELKCKGAETEVRLTSNSRNCYMTLEQIKKKKKIK